MPKKDQKKDDKVKCKTTLKKVLAECVQQNTKATFEFANDNNNSSSHFSTNFS